MNFLRVNLRIKLNSFINTELESKIIEKINDTHKKINYPFKLYLWFNDDEIVSHEKLKEFVKEKLGVLPYKTIIKPLESINVSEFAWFDIVSFKDKDNDKIKSNYRFRYIYNRSEQILEGLEHFEKILFFCLKPKPKRQKRNDYEDE
jgi:hypothetical protein